MITITLAQILDHDPCKSGWDLVYNANRDLSFCAPFPLANIVRSNGMDDALWATRCLPQYDTLWRLFAHRLACKAAMDAPHIDLSAVLTLIQRMAYEKVDGFDVRGAFATIRELQREHDRCRALYAARNALRAEAHTAVWVTYDKDEATDEDISAFLRLIGDLEGAANPPSRFRPEPT